MQSRISKAVLLCAAAAACQPAAADEGCALKQVASLPARYAARKILVDVIVDDAPVSFIVDTGAGMSLIGQELAKRLDLPVKTRPGDMYGVTGGVENNFATVRTLKLGKMIAHNQDFFVDANFGDGRDGHPAGIFGADYLGSYDIEIDLADGKLNLYSHDHCPDRVVYWDSEYFKLPFTHGNGRVPQIDIPVAIDGHALHGRLDTGAYNTTMRLAAAHARLEYDETKAGDETFQLRGVGSTAQLVGYKQRFSGLEFGPITLRNPLIWVAPVDMAKNAGADLGSHINGMRTDQPDIWVGMDVISKLRLYVDYADSALYFTLAQPPRPAR